MAGSTGTEALTKLRHIQWNDRLDPAANARRQLPRLVTDYFELVRGLLKSNPSPPELHQARLASKRMRYTLELFRPCYGLGLEARLEKLRRLQQMLGDVNDASATWHLLSRNMPSESAQRQLLEKFLNARADTKAQEFHKEWTEVFDAPGQLEWWTIYLARQGRRPARRG